MVDFPRLPDLPSPADQPLESAGVWKRTADQPLESAWVWKRTWYEWLRVTDKIVRTVAPSASDLEGRLDDLSGELDDAFDDTRGSILYRGASGWAALGPGTAGHRLQTNGAGADPTWAAIPSTAWVDVANGATTSGSTETFTDLGGYRDLGVVFDRVSPSSNAFFQIEVSADNGSTWATVIAQENVASSSLVNIAAISGTIASANFFSFGFTILGWGTTNAVKPILKGVTGGPQASALVSASAFNAIRLSPSAGNFDGGTIYIQGIPN